MPAATFDTLKFANTLKLAGVPDKQAEAQASAFAEVIQINFKELATKDDLTNLRTELKRDIGELRTELKHEMSDLRSERKTEMVLIKWMFGVTTTGILTLIGLVARLMLTQAR